MTWYPAMPLSRFLVGGIEDKTGDGDIVCLEIKGWIVYVGGMRVRFGLCVAGERWGDF